MRRPVSLHWKLYLLICEVSQVGDLWVAAFDAKTLVKVLDALRLIETHDPLRYARIARDLNGVAARVLLAAYGQFEHRDFVCAIDERYVAQASVEEIALVIVHEATHARLWRLGIGYSEDIRKRVESVCVRRERAFATRLRMSATAQDTFTAYLEAPDSFWSDETRYTRTQHALVAAGRYLKMPRWLIGCLLRRRRSLRRRELRAASTTQPPGD